MADQAISGPRSGKNVGSTERWVSGALGSALLTYALGRRSVGLLGLGAVLLYRGATGRCPLYKRLGMSSVRRKEPQLQTEAGAASPSAERKYGEGTRDLVDEASWESFPASDAPSYSPGAS